VHNGTGHARFLLRVRSEALWFPSCYNMSSMILLYGFQARPKVPETYSCILCVVSSSSNDKLKPTNEAQVSPLERLSLSISLSRLRLTINLFLIHDQPGRVPPLVELELWRRPATRPSLHFPVCPSGSLAPKRIQKDKKMDKQGKDKGKPRFTLLVITVSCNTSKRHRMPPP